MTKQIDIKELIPFMKDGWVAMSCNGHWKYYGSEPHCSERLGYWVTHSDYVCHIWEALNIKPVSDWTKSLIKLGEQR